MGTRPLLRRRDGPPVFDHELGRADSLGEVAALRAVLTARRTTPREPGPGMKSHIARRVRLT
ncbi:hypothetical protein ABZZ17_33250 [Streptomyces sp. NPDC006512]|uniref:hypothetical protein n=1 Tax=Streptomyces sp. NPDC006512 TaxID=3154307 RepID=UPI0033AF57EF